MANFSALKRIGIGAIIIGIVAYACVFVVNQVEQVVEVRLGDPYRVIAEPGLYFKIPFMTDLVRFDKRLLAYDSSTGSIITRDKKTLLVDNYARWRVVNALQFYETVRSEQRAVTRLDDIIYSQMREILGRNDFETIITKRGPLLERVTEATREEARSLGIHVEEVRIKRADLPDENKDAVYRRMEAERTRVAKRYLSEGEQAALTIRSSADRDKAVLFARARAEAAILRGKADAKAARTYAAAYGKNARFYDFWRSMEAYRNTLGSGQTTVLLSDDEKGFLSHFR